MRLFPPSLQHIPRQSIMARTHKIAYIAKHKEDMWSSSFLYGEMTSSLTPKPHLVRNSLVYQESRVVD